MPKRDNFSSSSERVLKTRLCREVHIFKLELNTLKEALTKSQNTSLMKQCAKSAFDFRRQHWAGILSSFYEDNKTIWLH